MARHQLVTALFLCCCLAAAKGEVIDFTEGFNSTLQGVLVKIPETLHLPLLPKIPLHIEGLADLVLHLYNINITGQSVMRAEDCTYDNSTTVVEMSLVLPYEAITCGRLNMKGVILDNINIDGEGPASIVLDNLRMTIRGNTSQNNWDDPQNPVVVFTDATLELVLERWTVELEGITPGSDLGTLMNSFFSAIGPDIFHVLADLINSTDLVMKILNIFFPPPTEENRHAGYPKDTSEFVVDDVVKVLTQYLHA